MNIQKNSVVAIVGWLSFFSGAAATYVLGWLHVWFILSWLVFAVAVRITDKLERETDAKEKP